jgi:hypothetical protein
MGALTFIFMAFTTHLFSVLRYKNIVHEFDTTLQNLLWICVCTLHMDFTID